MTEIDAGDVFEAYVKLISVPSAGYIRDAADLPYPKEIIQRVLEGLLQRCGGDPATQDQLASAYVILADFQPLTENEKSALSTWQSLVNKGAGSGATDDMGNIVKELDSVSDVALVIMERTKNEAEGYLRRTQEIKASTT